jgi:ribosomal protein L23
MASEKEKEKDAGKKKGKDAGTVFPESFRPEKVILYPYMTEKAVRMTAANTITFIVSRHATKNTVKMATEALYAVKVKRVRTENAADGRKKAFVDLAEGYSASDLASKLGML